MTRLVRWSLGAAAVIGSIHGIVSVYWGFGGDALVATVGDMVDMFAGARWMLIPVGAVKLLAATAPSILVACRPSWRRWRPVAWAGGIVLAGWGGLNTVSAWLLMVGLLPRPDDFDRSATIGHAALWDPLFACWGAALLCGMWLSRRARHATHAVDIAGPAGSTANG